MARSRASYRIVLRTAKGGFAKPRNAASFEIFYGKRRLIARTAFPKSRRLVKDKRVFLVTLIERIERRRLKILEARRKKIRKQRLQERRLRELKDFQKRQRRKIAISKPSMRMPKIEPDYIHEIHDSVLDFNKMKTEPAQTMKQVTISDVLITPFVPDGSNFSRVQIDKSILINYEGTYRHISIMNLTFEESDFIEVNEENFEMAFSEVYEKIYPQLRDYWNQTHTTTEAYILRLKFVYDFSGKEDWADHGISTGLARTQLVNTKQLAQLLYSTYRRLTGDEMRSVFINGKRKRRGARDYLRDGSSIFITGATLESSLSEY